MNKTKDHSNTSSSDNLSKFNPNVKRRFTNDHLTQHRVGERPNPNEWSEHELLTLREAVELWWPAGPLRVKSLRHAIKAGQLASIRIAGKIFVTPHAILEMSRCTRATDPTGETADGD